MRLPAPRRAARVGRRRARLAVISAMVVAGLSVFVSHEAAADGLRFECLPADTFIEKAIGGNDDMNISGEIGPDAGSELEDSSGVLACRRGRRSSSTHRAAQ